MNPCEISLEALESLGDYLLLDMRGVIAYQHGAIPGAVLWDGDESTLPREKPVVIYCAIGEKSLAEAARLREQGLDAYSLEGGFRAWLREQCLGLRKEEMERYDRQMLLPEIGLPGQTALKNASVLIVGAGGLGSPAALYLAGAGVGHLGICDGDKVSLSNLQRQVLHTTDGVGTLKADSAKARLQALNPDIRVTSFPEYLTPENAAERLRPFDFVIEAADNFETKFLVNDTCVAERKPFCHGGVLRFEGQVMTYVPGDYPCYRCVFEDIPPCAENCGQAGVLGAMAGIIGCVQALEALKYLTGAGELLTGRLWILDGLTMKTRLVRIAGKNPQCKACGNKA